MKIIYIFNKLSPSLNVHAKLAFYIQYITRKISIRREEDIQDYIRCLDITEKGEL